jgi:hypothetical protein
MINLVFNKMSEILQKRFILIIFNPEITNVYNPPEIIYSDSTLSKKLIDKIMEYVGKQYIYLYDFKHNFYLIETSCLYEEDKKMDRITIEQHLEKYTDKLAIDITKKHNEKLAIKANLITEIKTKRKELKALEKQYEEI